MSFTSVMLERDSQTPGLAQAASLPRGAFPARCPHLNHTNGSVGTQGFSRLRHPYPAPKIPRLGHAWLGPFLEHRLPCPSRSPQV